MNKKKIKNREPIKALRAFELYYAMGEKRTLQKCADQNGSSLTQIFNFKNKYFWDERILARDFQQIKTIRANSTRDIAEMKSKFSEAIRNSITRLFRTNEETLELSFKIEPKTIYELESAVKLWLLLVGESTEIHTVKVDVVETVINQVVQIIQLHVKDPKILGDIAVDLQKGKELIWNSKEVNAKDYEL